MLKFIPVPLIRIVVFFPYSPEDSIHLHMRVYSCCHVCSCLSQHMSFFFTLAKSRCHTQVAELEAKMVHTSTLLKIVLPDRSCLTALFGAKETVHDVAATVKALLLDDDSSSSSGMWSKSLVVPRLLTLSQDFTLFSLILHLGVSHAFPTCFIFYLSTSVSRVESRHRRYSFRLAFCFLPFNNRQNLAPLSSSPRHRGKCCLLRLAPSWTFNSCPRPSSTWPGPRTLHR